MIATSFCHESGADSLSDNDEGKFRIVVRLDLESLLYLWHFHIIDMLYLPFTHSIPVHYDSIRKVAIPILVHFQGT